MDLTQNEFKLFQTFISDKSGIYFNERKRDSLKISLLSRVKSKRCENFYQYYDYLKFHPEGSAEFKKLISLITVNETRFFRNSDHFKIFKKYIIPELIDKKLQGKNHEQPSLAIWSAGCATGEEPYSIAMSLLDIMDSKGFLNTQILGTDIDEKALIQTRRGIYRQNSLRNIDDNYTDRYFRKVGNQFKLSEKIKNMVNFEHHNLMHLPYPIFQSRTWDIIFCRNVIIYFKTSTVRKVIRNLYNCLSDSGYLFVGYSESLFNISDDFSPVQIDNTFVYKKETKKQPRKIIRSSKPIMIQTPTQIQQSILKDNAKILYNEAFKLFIKEDFDKALDKTVKFLQKEPDNTEGHFLIGRLYLEKGLFEQSASEFKRVIKKDSLFAQAYYFLGITYERLNQSEEAIKQFKKALFVDKEFALAYFNLALLLQTYGDKNEALRGYKNAIKCFRQIPAAEPLKFSSGFTVKTLVETCQRNVRRLQKE